MEIKKEICQKVEESINSFNEIKSKIKELEKSSDELWTVIHRNYNEYLKYKISELGDDLYFEVKTHNGDYYEEHYFCHLNNFHSLNDCFVYFDVVEAFCPSLTAINYLGFFLDRQYCSRHNIGCVTLDLSKEDGNLKWLKSYEYGESFKLISKEEYEKNKEKWLNIYERSKTNTALDRWKEPIKVGDRVLTDVDGRQTIGLIEDDGTVYFKDSDKYSSARFCIKI